MPKDHKQKEPLELDPKEYEQEARPFDDVVRQLLKSPPPKDDPRRKRRTKT